MLKNFHNILHKTGVRVTMVVFTFLTFSFLSIFSINSKLELINTGCYKKINKNTTN